MGTDTRAINFERQIEEALDQLDEALELLDHSLDLLRAGCEVQPTVATKQLTNTIDRANRLRHLIHQGARSLGLRLDAWHNRDALEGVVEMVTRRFSQPRRRLAELARFLEEGDVTAPSALRARFMREVQREAAQALRLASEKDAPLNLPGPEEMVGWLRWAWDVIGTDDESVLGTIDTHLPALLKFLVTVDAGAWNGDGGSSDMSRREAPVRPPPVEEKRAAIELAPAPEERPALGTPAVESVTALSGLVEPSGAGAVGGTPERVEAFEAPLGTEPQAQAVASSAPEAEDGTKPTSAPPVSRDPGPPPPLLNDLLLPPSRPAPPPTLPQGAPSNIPVRTTSENREGPTGPKTPLPPSPGDLPGPLPQDSLERLKETQPPAPARPEAGAVPISPTSSPIAPTPPPQRLSPPIPIVVEKAVVEPPARFLLPLEVQSLQNFEATHWISPSGRCEPSPGRGPQLVERIRQRFASELDWATRQLRFHRLWVLAAAAADSHGDTTLCAEDIDCIAQIVREPRAASAGRSDARGLTLWNVAYGTETVAPERLRILLFLEALRPDRGNSLSRDLAVQCVQHAGFESAELATFVLEMLAIAGEGIDGIAALRRALDQTATRSVDELKRELANRRKELFAASSEMIKQAQFKLITEHCKIAMREFVAAIQPLLKKLQPVDGEKEGQLPHWGADELRASIRSWEVTYRTIADRHGARENDRKWMDRRFKQVHTLASNVVEAFARTQAAMASEADKPPENLPKQATEVLRAAGELPRRDEELCRRLLRLTLGDDVAGNRCPEFAFAFNLADLIACPELISLIEETDDFDVEVPTPERTIGIEYLRDIPRAAAMLLETEPPRIAPDGSAMDQLGAALRDRDRLFILGGLSPWVTSQEQVRVHDARTMAIQKVHALAQAITQTLVSHLVRLAHPISDDVRFVCQEAQALADGRGGRAPDPALLAGWLRAVQSHAQDALAKSEKALGDRARALDFQRRTLVEQAVRERRYGDALLLLGEPTRASPDSLRATMWRREATNHFGNPASFIERMRVNTDKRLKELAEGWARGITGNENERRGLRRQFAELIFPRDPRTEETLLETDKGERPSRFFVPCRAIREWLVRRQLNPSFLPQLCDFDRIDIRTPEKPPTSDEFVDAVSNAATLHDGSLTVILAPKVKPDMRRKVLRELRSRGVTAGLIDDIDFCRLFKSHDESVRPNLIIGLLEILFEQIPLSLLNPFAAGDGQHVRVEMFVGRRTEVRDLVRGNLYSRVFSGRKLGKSALLRFIDLSQNGVELPSGNRLRVIYVRAVGARDESDLVDRIINELETGLQMSFGNERISLHQAPIRLLTAVLKRFKQENPRTSLLVILDEADVFVEAQLKAHTSQLEGSLSFQMRSEFEGEKDSHDLPRIRFLFSGYRNTNVQSGAWGNWANVLRLTPLSPSEAASLIAGPLARLGINAGAQAAAIAYRCGYQPAVLLCVGRRLLARIRAQEEMLNDVSRDGVEATEQHVLDIFSEREVQDEICNVVEGNFESAHRQKAVFAALVLELLELPPGRGLSSAAEHVLRRLRLVDPDSSWLDRDDDAARAQIGLFLDNFKDRHLVQFTEGEQMLVHLKFPHHLLILRQRYTPTLIRDLIGAIRRGEGDANPYEGVEALVDKRVLGNLRPLLLRPSTPELPVRAVVAASLWPTALNHRSGGIADRLGVYPACRVRAADIQDSHLEMKLLAVHDTSPAQLESILLRRSRALPPPLVAGGVDLMRWLLSHPGDLYETCGIGRLARQQVGWWFERVRGLVFPEADALERVMRATSGVPWLVGRIDDALCKLGDGDGGFNVSGADFRTALDTVSVEALRKEPDLLRGPASSRLLDRERELLSMVSVVSRHCADRDEDLANDLTQDFETLYGEYCPVPMTAVQPEDEAALGLLQDLGLLAVHPRRPSGSRLHRLAALEADDALYRILESMGATS